MPRRRARSVLRCRPPWTRSSSGPSTRIRRVASPAGSPWPPRSSRSSHAPIRRARQSASGPPRWPRALPRRSGRGSRPGRRGNASAATLSRWPCPPGRRDPRPARVAGHRRAAVRALLVAAVVVGGLFVASLPGVRTRGRPRSPRRRRNRPHADADATPTAVPTVKPIKAPTPVPKATPKPAAGAARDLCDPIFGFACGLEKGTYTPSRFKPAIQFKLGDGWSTSVWKART